MKKITNFAKQVKKTKLASKLKKLQRKHLVIGALVVLTGFIVFSGQSNTLTNAEVIEKVEQLINNLPDEAPTIATIEDAEALGAKDGFYAGSQDRVMVTSTSTHGSTVISPQVGEELNGVVDGTYTTQSDGEVLLFIDNEAGKWTVQVVGASQQTALHYVALSSSIAVNVGTGAGVGINLSNPAFFDTIYDPNSLISGDSIIIAQAGLYKIDLFAATQGSSITHIEINGTDVSTTHASSLEDDSGGATYTGVLSVGDVIKFSPEAGINYFTPSISVAQLPATETVLAGTIVPDPLHRAQLNSGVTPNTSTTGTIIDLDDAGFTIDDSNSLINLDGAGDSIRITKAGTYRVAFTTRSNAGGVLTSVTKNGSPIAEGVIQVSSDMSAVEWSGSLAAGDDIRFTVSAGSPSLTSISVQQLAASTVIAADDLLTNDQASSGYVDIGDMRMQWGTTTNNGTSARTVTFPVAFADTSYSLTATPNNSNSNGIVYSVNTSKSGPSGFTGVTMSQSGATTLPESNAAWSWTAIGLKP